MSNQPNDARRPTKAERKEQARVEREAIQRQMAARKRNRTIGLSLVALAVVAVIVAVVVLQPGGGSDTATATPAELLSQAPDAAQAAGCTEVQTTDFYGGLDQSSPEYADQAHIEGDERFPELPPLDSYPSTPPASGPHVGATTLPAGCTTRRPTSAPLLHSLEHGGSVVWYSPTAPQAADRRDQGLLRPERPGRARPRDRGPLRLRRARGSASRRGADGARRLAAPADMCDRRASPSRSTSRASSPTPRHRTASTRARPPSAGAAM